MTQPNNLDNAGVMSYTLVCDPNSMKLKYAGNGITASNGVTPINNDAVLAFPRLAKFKDIYRQYKIDGVKIAVTTDRECGLDNPVIFLTDKGTDAPITAVHTAMAQAHKQFMLTENRRTANYGWKPKTSSEKDYRACSTAIDIGDQNVIKVLQDVEAKALGVCTHRITVTAMVTLKDSKAPN